MECPSLYQSCLKCLLLAPDHLRQIITHVVIPTKTHLDLFVQAALTVQSLGKQLKDPVVLLVSTWPQEQLKLTNIFPGNQAEYVLHCGEDVTFLDMVMIGLLNMKEQTKLTVVDFSGVSCTDLFQLPILSLPTEERLSEEILNSIIYQCKSFDDDETMEATLSWKIKEMSQKFPNNSFDGHVPLEIHVDSKLNLTDWLVMGDEIIAMCTQDRSPFRFKFVKLSVDNFYLKEVKHLKWFLSSIDLEALSQLFIYGKKRSTRLVMWELHEQLGNLPNLTTFGLGVSEPRIYSQLVSPDDPKDEEIMTRCATVLNSWTKIQELQLIGMAVAGQLKPWLVHLRYPLVKLSLYACRLGLSDIETLASSSHLVMLKELALEKNELTGCGELLCQVARNASQLQLLNLRETKLKFHEKVSILTMLQSSETIETIAMYEQEDMLSTSGYQTVVEIACAIRSLKRFYVFPFNYRPFEIFYRESVQEACDGIRIINNRIDLELYY